LVSVAAGRAANELTALVGEVDRKPVDLRLGDEGDRLVRVEPFANVVRPFLERLVGCDLVE
jgi:hypothetical protein